MKTNNNGHFILLLGVFIFAAFIRTILNSSKNIVSVIASINIVSLWFVIYLILENAQNKFYIRLKNNTVLGRQTKIKKNNYFKKAIKWIEIVIFILGISYVIFFANSIINDIIGSFSLFLSIEEEYIYNLVQDIFYKKK
jgi:hypothetical protein